MAMLLTTAMPPHTPEVHASPAVYDALLLAPLRHKQLFKYTQKQQQPQCLEQSWTPHTPVVHASPAVYGALLLAPMGRKKS
jgi:hypothetical protein